MERQRQEREAERSPSDISPRRRIGSQIQWFSTEDQIGFSVEETIENFKAETFGFISKKELGITHVYVLNDMARTIFSSESGRTFLRPVISPFVVPGEQILPRSGLSNLGGGLPADAAGVRDE